MRKTSRLRRFGSLRVGALRWLRTCVVAGAFGFGGGGAHASDEPALSLSKLSLEELAEIEVRVPAKLPLSLREAPSVGAVITRHEVGSYGWLSLNDVLYRQPGFVPARDYERPTVAARGLYEGWNNNHLLLLVDGVPINNISNGTAYTWEVLPLFMMERAEIFRGPGSALYGTNATNGVVALTTREIADGVPVEASVRLGDAGTQIYDAFGGVRTSLVDLSLGYYHHRTQGNEYDSLDNSGRIDPATGAPQRFRLNDERRSHFAYAKLVGQGPLAGLSLQAHLQHWSFQTGHGWSYVVPDEPERAINTEVRAWLQYQVPPLLDDRLRMEYVAMVQRHVKQYRIKFLPNGFRYGYTFPSGVVEDIESGPWGFFGRAQVQYRLTGDMHVVAGVEDQVVSWGKDPHHRANVDLVAGPNNLMPYPNGMFVDQPDVFEPVLGHPINNVGVYLQYSTGRIFDRFVAATAGARYDLQSFDYVAITEPTRPLRHRSFDQLSPRLGVVAFPHEKVSVKGMVERAFRAPNPSELVTANSLLATPNVDMMPEEITTGTLAVDLVLARSINLRADWFYQQVENQIAFSVKDNKVDNIYSRRLNGVELEALFDTPVGNELRLGGFGNFTGTWLLGETIRDPGTTPSSRLTWAPKFVGNAGVELGWQRLGVSLQSHYQGRVRRRLDDRFQGPTGTDPGAPTASSAFRPASVAPWVTFDARVSVRVTDWLRVGVQGTNLFDSQGSLIKTQDVPFDFRIPGRRLLATLELVQRLLPQSP